MRKGQIIARTVKELKNKIQDIFDQHLENQGDLGEEEYFLPECGCNYESKEYCDDMEVWATVIAELDELNYFHEKEFEDQEFGLMSSFDELIDKQIEVCNQRIQALEPADHHESERCQEFEKRIIMCFQCFKRHEEEEKRWQLEWLKHLLDPNYSIKGNKND